MHAYSRSHLADGTLLRQAATSLTRENSATAEFIADIAEIDARELYRPAGYSSMYAYCVGNLRLTEDEAYKRIRVARTAREFPAIFAALAERQLDLTGVVRLAPFLKSHTADGLLAAAAGKSKSEIEQLLAECFPRPDLPTLVQVPSSTPAALCQLVPEPVSTDMPEDVGPTAPVSAGTAPPIASPAPRPRVMSLSADRVGLQFTISRRAYDKLRHVQALLGHSVPSGDLAEVFERCLDLATEQLEKQKFAATSRPRRRRRCAKPGERHIPADVQRAVWQRDGAQCTFVGSGGHRCTERTRLEFDHVVPVAHGGTSTVSGVRLRCRPHNQYEAERMFGLGFMQDKREAARRAAADRAAVAAGARARSEDEAITRDVLAGLRSLGLRADEARRAADYSVTRGGATLEERMRVALAFSCRRRSSRIP